MRSFLAKIAATLAAVAFAVSISTGAFAASEFEGKWQVKDTKGKPFEIILKTGNTVLINWDSEWTAKTTKKGNTCEKAALQNGNPVGQPTEAMKVQ